MNELKKLVINGTEYAVTDDPKIPVPAGCKAGQTVVVKAVDDAGRPTAWSAANLPVAQMLVLQGIYLEDEEYAIVQLNGEPVSSGELAVRMDEQPVLVHFAQQYNPDVGFYENYTMATGSRDSDVVMFCMTGGWGFEPLSRYTTYGGKQYQVWGYA